MAEVTIDMVTAAKGQAATRLHACAEDIDLLVEIAKELPAGSVTVQIGVGSGTFTLALFGASPAIFYTGIDHDIKAFEWEVLALTNCRFKGHRDMMVSDSAIGANMYRAVHSPMSVDLLIVDGNHSEQGVYSDLTAWLPNLKPGAWVFVHDFDGEGAPERYPGVSRACWRFFGRAPDRKSGWSAAWRMPQ